MDELLEQRDQLGESMHTMDDPEERKMLFDQLRDIEEELYEDYSIYPIYTGWGWRPPTPFRKYKRKPRKPIRRKFSPVLSPILEGSPKYLKKSKSPKSKSPKSKSPKSKSPKSKSPKSKSPKRY